MFKLLLVLVTGALCEHIQDCDFNSSVDISNGTHLSNGNINFRGVTYEQNQYYYDNVTKSERGCMCYQKTCIRKCCPLGQGYSKGTCVAVPGTDLDPPIWDDYRERKDVNLSNFHMIFGKVQCKPPFVTVKVSLLTKKYHMLVDGKLYIELSTSVPPWMKQDPDRYCIDTFVWQDPVTGSNTTTLDALVCFKADEDYEHNYTGSFICMLISCVFFIVTIAVYAWLPELHNLHGRVLMVYLACMCVGFVFLSTMQIMLTIDNITVEVCVALTFVIYFALLSAFFWLNVMCFDIWWTFSGKRGLSLGKLSMRARFCAYAAYAFGFPTALTALMAGLEYSDLPANPLLPLLRRQGCFLYGTSKLIYLYGPIVILCFANMVFFILTVWKITQINKQTRKTLKSKDSCSTDQHRHDKQRLLLYMKLFTIMGINWILEVISALYPQANHVWQFVDAYNVMIGLFIFIIFVCKKKIFRLMKKRFNESFRLSKSESGDMRQISHKNVKNWKEYQQQRGSLDTVRTSICCDSDNSRTKTSST